MDINLPKGGIRATGDSVAIARLAMETATRSTRSKTEHTADVRFGLPKAWRPDRMGMGIGYGDSLFGGGNVTEFEENEDARQILLKACRNIEKTHPVVHAAVSIMSRYPIRGLRLEHKDSELQRFYEEAFLEDLDFEDFLIDLGKVYWTDGMGVVYGNWDDSIGQWVGEYIIDNTCMYIEQVPFSGQQLVYFVPDTDFKKFLNSGDPSALIFERQFPGITESARLGRDVLLSEDRVTIVANKDRPSDCYGTPVMLRAWNTLRLESRMQDAMHATADRLYAPLLMFTIGGRLPDGTDYIPSKAALDAFRDNLDAALASSFRALITHSGVNVQEVVRAGNMQGYKGDIDMYDERILMAYGLSTSVLKPQSGNYATSAMEFQLAAQIMGTYQRALIQTYNRQAAIVAEAQGHYELDDDGDVIYEKRQVTDEDGNVTVKDVPKLDYPEMKFDVINFHDEQEERKFRLELKREGIPISNQDIAVGVDIDLEASEDRYDQDRIHEKVEEARRNLAIFNALDKQNLPIPPDLAKYFEDGIPPADVREKVDRFSDRMEGSAADYSDLMAGNDAMESPARTVRDGDGDGLVGEGQNNMSPRQRPQISDQEVV